ncbi:MAG: hypothetical protein QS748_03225 [Candidatus Endonucleobacter bathymodioli]|uniref:Uncharacterized protein n=1 Tax=Candidatus Endonucleibacter bathymodioli TaxID=539814 RepID=A0AA90NKI2_9GAMM|nr:hypothetical protein [Candidatus Endonucleobacter bathymodioli]
MDVSIKTNKKSRYLLLAGTFSVAILTPFSTFSATQGLFGNTSSGTMTISLIIPPKLKTEAANKIALSYPEMPTNTSFNTITPLCVKGNGLPNYNVTASGDQDTGDFSLTNGDSIHPYNILLWENNVSTPQTLKSGQPSQDIQPLGHDVSCEESSRLELQTEYAPDPGQSLFGAVNITINAQ